MPLKFVKPKKKNKDINPFVMQSGKFKEGKIDTAYRDGWAEDVFMADSKERETIGKSFDFAKIPLISFALIFFLFVLLVKTAWLQVVKGDYYSEIAEGNRIRTERIEAKRGIIYDRNHQALVRNKANFLLYFVPIDLPDMDEGLEEVVKGISDLLGDKTPKEIMDKINTIPKYSLEGYRPLFIKDNIDYETAMMFYLRSSDWPGVILSTKTRRSYMATGVEFYIDKEKNRLDQFLSLSHIIGYTGKINPKELESSGDEYSSLDYIGKMGIEKFWESELKGVGGEKKIEVDAFGREKKITGQTDAIDGNNLVLSLDMEQQNKIEEILKKQLDEMNLTKATAVVLDPNNGEVLAIVSIPSFDNNLFAGGISVKDYGELINHPDKPLFNRAVSGEFPSGSTFKPVMLAAALQERIVSENTSFLSTGGLRIGQWFFPDWRAGGHGMTSARNAISDSVNTYFYIIGGGHDDFVGLGVDRIVRYGKMFGLSAQTGIDTTGEATGFLPSREWKEEVKGERWYIGDTYHLSIGQGDLLATPLQVALFTSVFANGGTLYRPHFVTEILSGDDEIVRKIENVPVRKDFIDEYNMMVVRQGMKRTVTHGSGRRLKSLSVEAAGKTGTAQWSTKKENHAWFTSFAPYDEPEIVVTVLIEEGVEGSTAAVPVVQEYMEWYFSQR
jgi:penicillin-binding protein 2